MHQRVLSPLRTPHSHVHSKMHWPSPIQSTATRTTVWTLWAVIAFWAVAIVAGWAFIQRYDLAANASTHSFVGHWPTASAVEIRNGRPTVVLFMHPKCPCTRASLQELNRLYASLGEAHSTHSAPSS